MSKESRVIHLQKELIQLKNFETLKALNWMIGIMNADNGYSRHDGSHYYYHLVDGCQDLINHGITDQNTLTAFVLHDSIEDIVDSTGKRVITTGLLKEKFNAEVALLVDGVTKMENVNYKDGKELEKYLAYILQFSKMCLIKTADRKHNFSTLEHASPKKEMRQARETKEYFIPFFKKARKMHPEYSAYFHSAKTAIVPHMKKIFKYHEELSERDKRIEELEFKLSLLIKGEK
ncbi:MAG: HD domain-containing protein [Psychrobacillus sp.]